MRILKRLGRLAVDLLVPLVAIAAAVAVYRLGVMALVERLLPASEGLVTVIRRIGVVGSLFVAYWAVARLFERRRLAELVFRPRAIAVGALSGVGLIGATIASLFVLGFYRLVEVRGLAAALPIIGTVILAVIFEEALFRGVFFRILERDAGTVRALVVQSLLFGLVHLGNDGTTALTFVSVTLIGAFWALIYVATRNLWVLAAHHAAWNVTIFVSGVPLSGMEEWRRAAPFESLSQGPWWLTGGAFGPEDSILNIALVACAIVVLGRWAWRRGRFIAGRWGERGKPVSGPSTPPF